MGFPAGNSSATLRGFLGAILEIYHIAHPFAPNGNKFVARHIRNEYAVVNEQNEDATVDDPVRGAAAG